MMATVQLAVKGMASDGCARAVETALRTVPGVIHVSANYEKGEATVEAADTVPAQALADAVVKAGYEARVEG
jgi:copper chaperone CopZ